MRRRARWTLYEREICPTRVRVEGQHGTLLRESVLDRITDFDDDLHCLAELERLTGIHSDAALDFSLEQSAIRNRKGQVTSATQRDGAASLVLQEVRYDASYRPEFITRPGYGTTEIRYDPATGLVSQVIAPDGVATRAGERDPLSDAMRELVGDRGPSGVLTSQFRFDDMERLSKSWQDFGGSSESQPLSELSYLFPDHDRPGAILERSLIDADRGIVNESAALVGSDGESVASLGRIPEGWAVGDLVKRDLNNLEIASLRRSPLPASATFAVPTYAALEAGARSLSEERTAGFGHTTARRATVQSGVEQVVETTVDLSDGARVTTAVENGTYQVRSGRDLGGRLLWSEDQLGKVTRFDYDALGRVVAATLPGGATHANRLRRVWPTRSRDPGEGWPRQLHLLPRHRAGAHQVLPRRARQPGPHGDLHVRREGSGHRAAPQRPPRRGPAHLLLRVRRRRRRRRQEDRRLDGREGHPGPARPPYPGDGRQV